MSTHALYRFFDEAGDLLYVGITMNPASRWKQHSLDKDWWVEVANITIEPHQDRKAVLEAERLSILTERPRYNVIHNARTPALTVRAERIAWRCTNCDEEVLDGDGYLALDEYELRDRERCVSEWEEQHPGDSHSLADWSRYPDDVRWLAWHADCDPHQDEGYGYLIEINEVRTYRQNAVLDGAPDGEGMADL